MARTATAAKVFARFGLLEMQIRTMLREATEIDADNLGRISKGLKEPHYIETIAVRGLFPRGTIGAELRLSVDWRTYKLEMASGGSRLQIPSSWTNGVAPSIDEGVRTFLSACSMAGLNREWVVIYGAGFNGQDVNRILGFSPAPSRAWDSTPETAPFRLGPLREASLVVSLAV
jgi:hypothetical protein